MVYYKLVFGVLFLPLTIIAYQIFPKKYRWVLLLLASMGFYLTFSLINLVFPFMAAIVTYIIGRILGKLGDKKKNQLAELKGKENKEKKPNFGDSAMIAMFMGLVSAYIGSYIGGFISGEGTFTFKGDLTPLIVSVVSAIVMAIFTYFAEKKHMVWLESFSIAGSMLVGMLAAIFI